MLCANKTLFFYFKSFNSIFILYYSLKNYLCIYLFLAVLGFCYYAGLFSSFSEWGLPSSYSTQASHFSVFFHFIGKSQFSLSVVSDALRSHESQHTRPPCPLPTPSPPKPMSIESVMPSNHFILCCPLLLPPSIFPSISLFK